MAKDESYTVNGFSLEAIRNRNETRVAAAMREELADAPDFCGCRLCVEDVYAAALNQLPSRYSQVGSIVVRGEVTDAELASQVRAGVDRVTRNPNHPPSTAAAER